MRRCSKVPWTVPCPPECDGAGGPLCQGMPPAKPAVPVLGPLYDRERLPEPQRAPRPRSWRARVVNAVADVLFGKVDGQPWTPEEPVRIEELEELQREVNELREQRRAAADKVYWCMFPGCGRTDVHSHRKKP